MLAALALVPLLGAAAYYFLRGTHATVEDRGGAPAGPRLDSNLSTLQQQIVVHAGETSRTPLDLDRFASTLTPESPLAAKYLTTRANAIRARHPEIVRAERKEALKNEIAAFTAQKAVALSQRNLGMAAAFDAQIARAQAELKRA